MNIYKILYVIPFLSLSLIYPMHSNYNGLGLLNAAHNGMIAQIKTALESNTPVNFQDASGETALHKAAAAGKIDTVNFLLQANADATIKNNAGETALHKAVERGNILIIRVLLQFKSILNVQNVEGDTALHKAAYRGDMPIVDLFAKAGARLTLTNKRKRIPYETAIDSRKPSTAQALLNHRDAKKEQAKIFVAKLLTRMFKQHEPHIPAELLKVIAYLAYTEGWDLFGVSSQDPVCCICLEGHQLDAKTSCNHDFHTNCLTEWLNTNSTCPTCRNQIIN
ncbi:ankyrin repeat domain-containing protein [Candidatus Dependentiae bacterium]|nr:ankyrin repeat domain-containing protein [Candidatus Dependentiae bacterium]